MTRKQMLQIKHNPCGKATAIKQNNHVSNGFNRSVSITNRIQSSTPLRYLFKWSSSIIPEENLLQRCKLARRVTSAYLTVSDMTLTEDGVTKALWKCVNYPALSGILGPHVSGPSAWRKQHWCQRCSPSWEQVSLSEPSADATNHLFTKKTQKYINIKPARSLLLKGEPK